MASVVFGADLFGDAAAVDDAADVVPAAPFHRNPSR